MAGALRPLVRDVFVVAASGLALLLVRLFRVCSPPHRRPLICLPGLSLASATRLIDLQQAGAGGLLRLQASRVCRATPHSRERRSLHRLVASALLLWYDSFSSDPRPRPFRGKNCVLPCQCTFNVTSARPYDALRSCR